MMKVLPSAINKLPRLEKLLVSENNIEKLEFHPNELICLKVFDISINKLKTIPSSIKYLTELVTLKLADNNFSELPDESNTLLIFSW
jgi:Leucine-rich repeat (LRR) protein